MPKAIGWDIGIKNLAYCVLESKIADTADTADTSDTANTDNLFTFNNNKYNICKWADISLVSQIESNLATSGEVSHINNTLICCGTKSSSNKKTKNKTELEIEYNTEPSICGKKAFYAKEEVSPSGVYSGLCKTHFKKLKINRLPILSVKKCWTEGCSSKPVQVLKEHIFKGFCKKHINEMHKAKTYNDADFFKINHAKTTSKIDINNLGIALFQELNKIKVDITEPSIILLENQPVLKNPTMKSMQMFIYSFYLMNILDSNIELCSKKLQCYCASKKLDMIKFLTEEEQTRITTFIETVNNPYQKNKKMAIMMTEALLQNNAKWLSFFKSHPKQDDLADSLLMTLHYFSKALSSRAPLKEKEEAKTEVEKIDKKNKNSCRESASDKQTKGKSGLKPSKIPLVDVESSLVLDEVKSKKRNRIINNNKYKKE